MGEPLLISSAPVNMEKCTKSLKFKQCRTVNAELRNRAAASNRRSCVGQTACIYSRLDDLLQKICITVARLSGADEASAERPDMGPLNVRDS